MVLAAGQSFGAAAAAARVLHGVGAEVPVDDNVRRPGARRHMVVVEIAVCTHWCGAVGGRPLKSREETRWGPVAKRMRTASVQSGERRETTSRRGRSQYANGNKIDRILVESAANPTRVRLDRGNDDRPCRASVGTPGSESEALSLMRMCRYPILDPVFVDVFAILNNSSRQMTSRRSCRRSSSQRCKGPKAKL